MSKMTVEHLKHILDWRTGAADVQPDDYELNDVIDTALSLAEENEKLEQRYQQKVQADLVLLGVQFKEIKDLWAENERLKREIHDLKYPKCNCDRCMGIVEGDK